MEKVIEKPVMLIQENTDLPPVVSMNVQSIKKAEEENPVANNEQMISLYKEILDYCREDRKDASETFNTFLDMVVNEGDATSASKESLVQLLKIRSEVTDKMSKVMDLLMRALLKDHDTYPKYLAANQENRFIFKGKSNSVRGFLEKLNRGQKAIEENKNE